MKIYDKKYTSSWLYHVQLNGFDIIGKQGLWNIDSNEYRQWWQFSGNGDVIIPEVVEFEELTDDEQQELLHLECKVERAFYEAGSALAQLRHLRLYRSTHGTFEKYCQERFSFTRRHVNYLISAATVVENLKMGTIGSQNFEDLEEPTWLSLPTTERQCRPLSSLDP